MGRLRVLISLLVVVGFVLFVTLATIRARDWTGIKLVVCIFLLLNFGCLILIATDLDSPIRLSSLAYLVGSCGWIALVCCLPSIDGFFRKSLITPELIEWIAPGPNPYAPKPDPAVESIHLLAHATLSIGLGSLGGFLVWSFVPRYPHPDSSITPTTGPS
jgi:hypothetical protein